MDINEFLGNGGIEVFPNDSEIIANTVDLFIGDDFFWVTVILNINPQKT